MIPGVASTLSMIGYVLSWTRDKVKIDHRDQSERRRLLFEVVADAPSALSKPYDQPPDASSPLRQVQIAFAESSEVVEAWRNLNRDWSEPDWREERLATLIRAMAKAVGKDLGDLTDRSLIHPFERPRIAEGHSPTSNRQQASAHAAPCIISVPEPRPSRRSPLRNGRRSQTADPRQSRFFDA